MAQKPQPSRLRGIMVLLIGLYILGLIVYLLLRLAHVDMWWVALLHSAAPYLFAPIIVLLPLTLLLRMPRLAGWLVLMTVIALVWFAPLFFPKPLPALPANYLTLISFNAFPENERLSDVERWLLLKNADVIFLQETDGALLAKNMPALVAAYPYRRSQAAYNGATILSRYRFISTDDVTLAGRTASQTAVIDYRGKPLTLYNLHLEMPMGETPHLALPLVPNYVLDYDETRRNTQIHEVLALITQAKTPYVVAGDFNLSEFSFIYQDLAAAMGDVYRETNTGFGLTFPAGRSEDISADVPLLLRLDYVWHSAGVRPLYSEIGPDSGSDHLPLFVALEVTD